MKNLLAGILLLFSMSCSMQVMAQNAIPEKREDGVYFVVDQMPVFKGGQEALGKFFSDTMKYPLGASVQGISGRVIVSFVVQKSGETTDHKIVRSIHSLLDNEALRVVKMMPKWIPGKKDGKTVPVLMNIPIKFGFENETKEMPSFIFDSGESSMKDLQSVSLSGIWQMCMQFQPQGNDKYLIRTGTYLKVLSTDSTMVNMFFDSQGGPSAITAMGTYKKTSASTYVESIFRSVTDPTSGKDMTIQYKFIGPNLLDISYQLPNRQFPGHEIWIRVVQPNVPLITDETMLTETL